MNIKEFFNNKRNVATFTFILIITVILTLFIATSHSKYVLEKELKFNLQITESEEWNKRTLITGEELNKVLKDTEATQIIFGYEDDYAEEIKDIEGTAVGLADETKEFKEDDIQLYTVTNSENNKIALILSKYQIKANADSSKMFYNYETLTNVVFSNFDTSIVENMEYMFYGCKNLIELDLYKFETPKLKNITNMFCGDTELVTIYVSELWNIEQIKEEQENVFTNCLKLKGENGTTYDVDNPITTSKYACIDTEENTGYFTYKSSVIEEEPITFNLVRPSSNDTQKESTTNTNTTNTTNTLNTTTNTVTTNNETTNTTSSSNTTTNTTTSATNEEDTKTDEENTTTNNTNTNNVVDSNTTTTTNTTTDTTNTTSTSQEPDTTSVVGDEEKEIDNNIETTGTENVVTN